MERWIGFLDFQNVDVRREDIVDFHTDNLWRKHCLRFEMGHLAQCMNTGISPARSMKFEVVRLLDIAQRANDLSLNSPRILLELPAAVPRSFIFKIKFEASHRSDQEDMERMILLSRVSDAKCRRIG